ncbi:MAG TPA: polysaccharide deacetylase [Allosphingosinicella sp.]|jgi:peptidoglycan/xylan/chitin deacetylase (PgdA/CDA1 family)
MVAPVLLTVDTELTWRHYARGASWQENFACAYEAAGAGVPYQLDLLRAHGLKACFFVDPMPALVYGLEPVRRMVAPILEAGQEVQLHLHSFWHCLANGGAEQGKFELTGFNPLDQRDLIATARDLLVEAGAPPPVAFRSGSYAADEITLDALASLGIRYDSSHNGSHHPWPSALPLDPALIAPVEHRGVVEVPVGQIEDGDGKLRHLQVTALSFSEFRAALLHAADHGHPLTTIVSHSFELATRDGLRPNPVLKLRFERLCAFLADERAQLPTAHFTDLGGLPLGRAAAPLPSQPVRRARRMAEQLWANAVYERAL